MGELRGEREAEGPRLRGVTLLGQPRPRARALLFLLTCLMVGHLHPMVASTEDARQPGVRRHFDQVLGPSADDGGFSQTLHIGQVLVQPATEMHAEQLVPPANTEERLATRERCANQRKLPAIL